MMKQIKQNENTMSSFWIYAMVAYVFSMAIRMIWVYQFQGNPAFTWNGELMINTNDGYAFANAARDLLQGIMPEDGVKQAVHHYSTGLVYLTYLLAEWTPLSLETVILYLPAVISSLVVIPIILSARLMGHTLLGFFAALLGSIVWSYYNRTMVGYYDTDMFSVLLQFSIFYGMLQVAYHKSMSSILLTAFLIFVYPLFYPQGMTIVFAMFVVMVVYLVLEYRKIIATKETDAFREKAVSLYGSIMLLSVPLMLALPAEVRIGLFVLVVFILFKWKLSDRQMMIGAGILFVGFLVFSNLFGAIIDKVFGFLDRGVEAEGLRFYQVIQTVREAGSIPFSTMANRISGSQIGVFLSLAGYIVLVIRHKPFIIALPMIGVGILSLWAGLRFTVYAVPIAALSAVYLFWIASEFVSAKKGFRYGIVAVATAMMIYPNIVHIIAYRVPTVLNKAEVQDLEKLKSVSTPRDYTIAWWDYGYPIWFYSNTNTLIDGGKHTHDNFLISTILQAPSSQLAANLSRLAVEAYVDFNYSMVADALFKNKQKGQLDPNLLLSALDSDTYTLPEKTRDIYLYLPYRMLNIFPTVMVFGNLDLNTGQKIRNIAFYPTQAISNKGDSIVFANGIVFDAQKGEISMGGKRRNVKSFIVTQNTKDGQIQLQSKTYNTDGEFVVVYMKSYGRFLIVDSMTFKSAYIQMFVLGKYDKNLFDLVVSSPYSRIYRLKI